MTQSQLSETIKTLLRESRTRVSMLDKIRAELALIDSFAMRLDSETLQSGLAGNIHSNIKIAQGNIHKASVLLKQLEMDIVIREAIGDDEETLEGDINPTEGPIDPVSGYYIGEYEKEISEMENNGKQL